MTYQELLELKHKRAEEVAQGKELLAKKDLEGHKALMAEIDEMNAEIEATEKQLELEGKFGEQPSGGQPASKMFAPGQENREGDGYAKAVKSFAGVWRLRSGQWVRDLTRA